MKNSITLLPDQISAEGFAHAFSQGMDGIRTAAMIVAAMVDKKGPTKAYKEIMSRVPQCPLNLVGNLERFARGAIAFELLYDCSPASSKIKHLPPAQQKECYSKPIKVVSIENGKKVVTEKPAMELSAKECQIVFESGKLNSPEEQANKLALIVNHSKPAQRYEILDDGTVIIQSKTVLTPSQVQDIYERVKDKSIKSLAHKKAA